MWTDRQKDMAKIIGAFRSFANGPKNDKQKCKISENNTNLTPTLRYNVKADLSLYVPLRDVGNVDTGPLSLDALKKRKVSCPCRESNHDFSVIQLY
jgi:hypothetical protein